MRSGHFEAVRPFMDQEEVAALTCKVTFQCNPPTPAFAKAGAAPGTTAGVELVFLSFKCFNASRQLRSACRLPPQPSLVRALHAQPHTQKPHGHINGFLAVKQATPRPHQWGGPACRKPFKRLNILLACLIPQPTGTPRPHQWLLMGVQACRLPGLKSADPGLRQGRGGAWDHCRCGTCLSQLQMLQCFAAASISLPFASTALSC